MIGNGRIGRFDCYSLDGYIEDVETRGLRKTWELICEYVLNVNSRNPFFAAGHIGELYEIGLAARDKQEKKESGQYYTPEDVASVMSGWLKKSEGENVCDVACGTGQLILSYLALIGKKKARELIAGGHLYLYDLDPVALKICKTLVMMLYGKDLEDSIHDLHADFLDRNVSLPGNCKTIANPPYAAISHFKPSWDQTGVLTKTKELYSAFMEKIILQSRSAVIITPYSFVSGKKFYPLRELMSSRGGQIYTFDNVPGNIFRGRKHGVFNSNTSNSVRAAVTVVQSGGKPAGFQLTPLIRFKSEERENLLQCGVLESFLSDEKQTVSPSNPMFRKNFRCLQDVFHRWMERSGGVILKDLTAADGKHILSMPNTCRYYTTAVSRPLRRSGQITLRFDDINKFHFAFCLINSSFAYWHWRMYDGGITYPRGLLMNLPVFFDSLSENDLSFFNKTARGMIANAHKFLITKKNVGVQENIKYPKDYRDKINKRILDILGMDVSESVFDVLHSNKALEISL